MILSHQQECRNFTNKLSNEVFAVLHVSVLITFDPWTVFTAAVKCQLGTLKWSVEVVVEMFALRKCCLSRS